MKQRAVGRGGQGGLPKRLFEERPEDSEGAVLLNLEGTAWGQSKDATQGLEG